jgi:plastocyanin
MSEESSPGAGVSPEPRHGSEWMKQLIIPVAVSVAATLLVTALTPLGDSVRELLFPTRAAVTGSVHLDGVPVADARLKLDGADATSSDDEGRFLLTSVGDGEHRLGIEAAGARPRNWAFTVDRGETTLDVGQIGMKALVQLGYVAAVRPSAVSGFSSSPDIDYDITLWIIGGPAARGRIKSVSYTLPAPLPTSPVRASGSQAFCYRRDGTVSFQDLFTLGGTFATAMAEVELHTGQPFQISAQPVETRPPNCRAHHAGSQSTTEPSSGGWIPMTAPDTSPPSEQMVMVPDVRNEMQDVAQQFLEGFGFVVDPVEQASAEVEIDRVIGTQPAAGEKAKKGSIVKMLVSTGPERTKVRFGCSPSTEPAEPVHLNVDAGTEVQFVNEGTQTMTLSFSIPVPSESLPAHIEPGESFAITFDEPNYYPYTCDFGAQGSQYGKIGVTAT